MESAFCISDNEKIITSALKVNLNENTVIVTGHRHGDCFKLLQELCSTNISCKEIEEGFITSLNRFVDRIEAKAIAVNAGQLIRESQFSELISEDIY